MSITDTLTIIFNPVRQFILCEHSPRPWTWVYEVSQFREIVMHRVKRILPAVVGLTYFYQGAQFALDAALVNTYLDRFVYGLLAGVPTWAASGALWTWLAARLIPFLDDHPQTQKDIAKGYRLPSIPEYGTPFLVLGESHPSRLYNQEGDYLLKYSVDELYSPTPDWTIIKSGGLVTGTIVMGNTGSGKTAFIVKSKVFPMFNHKTRPGGLIMDSKASLVTPLENELNAAGRSGDFLPIGPLRPVKWNPLHQPLAEPATLAAQIMTINENVKGALFSGETKWIRSGAEDMLKGCIGLIRLMTTYVTASAIVNLMNDIIVEIGTRKDDAPAVVVKEYLENAFIGNPRRSTEQYDYFSKLLVRRFSEHEKFTMMYLSEALEVLDPLTAPGLSSLYCPKEDEINMPAWTEVINQGLVIVLDCNNRVYPNLAVVLGMFLKLGYQDTILARLQFQRIGLCDADRYMMLVIDEYQQFASPNDSEYMPLCRESKSISIFLTQGYASIIEKVKKDAADVILQSMRNRIILSQSMPEFAADLLGEEFIEEVDKQIHEHVDDASLQATGRFAGKSSVSENLTIRRNRQHVAPPEMLANLPLGQAIVQVHDGVHALPLHRVFLTPAGYYGRHADLKLGG